MKNNNIEEDIKIVKELLHTYELIDYRFGNMLTVEQTNAIENILADREQCKKLYERALSDLVQAEFKANKYDSLVEKIKKKIEAYSKNCTVINSFIVEALQELLKGE